jgi:hypothetical protein
VVIDGVVASARAAAMLLEQVGRVGHAFHAAGDDQVDRAAGQRLGAHDDRLHARAADLVDGARLDRLGQARLKRNLAGGGLAEAGRQHAAHIDALDVLALHTGALDRGFDGGGAQVGRRNVGEHARKTAHRSAGVRKDDDRIIR